MEKETKEIFGKRIKDLQKSLNINSRQFALKTNIHPSYMTRVEKGKAGLTSENIAIICKEFNVNHTWIMTGEGEMFNNVNKKSTNSKIEDKPISELSIIHNLVESNKELATANKALSEAHLLIAKDHHEYMNRTTVNTSQGISQEIDTKFSELLELIAEVGSGKKWENTDAAVLELSKRFHGKSQVLA